MSKFVIYADEAWTHNSPPLNRYHNFFGGIFGQEKYIDRLNSGGLVYRFQPPPDNDVPAHDLCTHCYQQGIKPILQFAG